MERRRRAVLPLACLALLGSAVVARGGTSVWESARSIPKPSPTPFCCGSKPGLMEAQGGAADGKLFLFGGYNTNGTHGAYLNPLCQSWAFDPSTGAWSRRADLPAPYFTHAGTTTDGRYFYLVGGFTLQQPGDWCRNAADRGTPSAGIRQGSAAVWRYDVANDRFERLPDLPWPRGGGAAVAFPDRNELHFWGGTDPATPTTGVDYRDHVVLDLSGCAALPCTSTWQVTDTPLPPDPDHPAPGWGVNHVGGVRVGDSAYLIGGQHLTMTALTTYRTVWRYTPGDTLGSGTYTAVAPLPSPRSHVGNSSVALTRPGALAPTDIAVLGGERRHAGAISSVNDYDVTSDRWTPDSDSRLAGALPPLPRRFDGGVAGAFDRPDGTGPTLYAATGSFSPLTMFDPAWTFPPPPTGP